MAKGEKEGNRLAARSPQRPRFGPWEWGVAAGLALFAIYLPLSLKISEPPHQRTVDDVAGFVMALAACVVMFAAARHTRPVSRRLSAAWILLGLAYLCYTIGELFSLLGVDYGQGFKSYFLDFFYVAYYPLFLMGILRLPSSPLNRSERLKLIFDTAVVVLAAGMLLWSLLVLPALSVGIGNSLRTFNAIAFPMGDLALLWAAFTLVFSRRERSASIIYMLLAASAVLLVITDFGLTYRLFDQLPAVNRWLGPGWFLSHLLAALAAGRQLASPTTLEPSAEGLPHGPTRLSGGSFFLAYACLAAVLMILVVSRIEVISPVTGAVLAALLVLVLGRQIIGLRENEKLYTTLRQAHDELEDRVRERTTELAEANSGLQAEVAERKRTGERLQRQLKELTVLGAVAELAVDAQDEETLLAAATETIRAHLYPDNCGVLLLSPSGRTLGHVVSYHRRSSEVAVSDVPVSQGIVGRAVRTGSTVVVHDVTRDPDYLPMDPEMRSEIAVPLKVGNRVLGVLDAESRAHGAFTPDDERVLSTLASQLATALLRLRTDAALQQSEERFRSVVQHANDIITIHDADGTFRYQTPSAARLLGYGPDGLVGRNPFDLVHPDDLPALKEAFERVLSKRDLGIPREYRVRHEDGRWIHVESLGTNLLDNPAIRGLVLTTRDITERRQALQALAISEERFRSLVQNSSDVITIHDTDGTVIYESPSAGRILGYEPGFLTGKSPLDFVHPEDLPAVAAALQRVAAKTNAGVPTEYRFRRGDGRYTYVESVGNNMMDHPAVRGIVLTSREITDRKEAETRIQLQIKRLAALRDIDSAINSSLDLHITLQMFLDHAVTQLNVDAADILLLEPETGILHFAAGAGFRSDALRHSHVPMGASFAGRAALEERVIEVQDLTRTLNGLVRSPHLREEGFLSYAAAPLIVKGQVTGVLEVFTRSILDPDPEWMDFLQTLAGQGAIAVDNRSLFERIRNANRELAEAYDRTLEGWSKALELRDHETQGHTMRVLESTVKLARLSGIEEKDMVHVRRGVLLHDIGKMGIPDHILLKPGPLTEEEWVVMRRHTTYAFDLLWPIPFLRPALDIPYCHHERWDGQGYPRGLRGEEIPLAARAFSVVDSWDALSYDRPYRKAWSQKKVRAYLKEKAGSHFDPSLVDLFLEEGP
jgi:PAS domain S-box-containing protein